MSIFLKFKEMCLRQHDELKHQQVVLLYRILELSGFIALRLSETKDADWGDESHYHNSWGVDQ